MIQRKHPTDRAERRRLKEIHEKTERFRTKAKAAIRDEETQDELRSYRSGEHSVD